MDALFFSPILGIFLFFVAVFTFQYWLRWIDLPLELFWIGIPMGPLLVYAFFLLWFIRRFRPIRIRIVGGKFYLDNWDGEQVSGEISKNPDKTQLKISFLHGGLGDGWVGLDIDGPGIRWYVGASRKVYKLKLDDAIKLIAFGRANNLKVSLDSVMERVLPGAGG